MAWDAEDLTLCIVSHDAGGAEVLASYVARSGLECKFVLAGPAIEVFERRVAKEVDVLGLDAALEKCDAVLCGTSWKSDLEWRAVARAKEAGKPVRSFLDHWSNYKQRFMRDGVEVLPDELWVGDALSEDLAKETFPQLPVTLVPNPYFADILDQLSNALPGGNQRSQAHAIDVLFVCEPISEHAAKVHGNPRHWGYTEFDAIRFLLSNLAVLGQPVGRVLLRPHPSEPRGKYDLFLSKRCPNLKIGGEKSLLQEILESDVIVGCDTMAMVVGLLAKRRVISAIPPGGAALTLPHAEIEKLALLVSDFSATAAEETSPDMRSVPASKSSTRGMN